MLSLPMSRCITGRPRVAGVEDHFDAAREVELGRDLCHVRRDHVHGLDGTVSRDEILLFDQRAKVLDVFAVDGRSSRHDFEAVVLGGVVAAGDHDSALSFQMKTE